MAQIVIAECSASRLNLLTTLMSDHGLTHGMDFVCVNCFDDAPRRLTPGEPQLIVFGSSPDGLSGLDEVVREARNKKPDVVIVGFFEDEPGSLLLDLYIDSGNVEAVPRNQLVSALRDFQAGRLVSGHVA